MTASSAQRGLARRWTARLDRIEIERGSVVVGAIAFIVVALTYARMYFGADFTDQAYYVVVPYRFALGARPFIDETAPQQTAGLLVFPFISAYHAVFGVSGIILFARHLHFLFSVAVASCVYLGLRPFARTRAEGFLPSLIPIAFVPFNLPDLSYNNLASGFFVAGCFLGLRSLATQGSAAIATAGLAHGLAIFVYPTFVLPALVYVSILTLLGVPPRRRILVSYAVGVVIPVAALVAVFAHAGLDNIRNVFTNARDFSNEGGSLGKALRIAGEAATIGWRAPLGLLALAAAIGSWRYRPRLAALLLWVIPLLLVPLTFVRRDYGSLYYVMIYGMLALPLYVLRRHDATTRRLFLAIWPAAFVGGLAPAWSSANGAINFALGFLPAAVITTLFLARAADAEWPPAQPRIGLRTILANTSVVVFLALQFTSVYRDRNIAWLGSRVQSGAYAGIYTTAEKRMFIARLTSDVRRLASAKCRILFYDNFPAGYLLSRSHAYTNAAWLLGAKNSKPNPYHRVLLRYYERKGALPDVVVRMTIGFGKREVTEVRRDPLDRLVTQSRIYRIAAKRDTYSIYDLRSTDCLGPGR